MSGKHDKQKMALPVIEEPPSLSRMGRRRAWALVIVHLLIAIHIAQYLITGTTLSPLEPSEAGYSIRNGAVNAGAIFLCVLLLSTLVLGRLFCGWACHLVAYQDLARWILLKLHIRPKAIRARLLILVPLFAAFWLYGLPMFERSEQTALSWHITTDNFWRTFPGLSISLLTFGVCGFLMIYFMGSKGYCTYGCPYGALFGIADRFAKGRIRVTDACDSSGQCTRNCSSNVNVAREVRLYGKVVDPGCLKCMDCISGCPNDALFFGFTPKVERDAREVAKAKRAKRHYDFSWREELFMAVLFCINFVIIYNLYRVVPFLLAVGLSVLGAYGLLLAVRLWYASAVSVQNLTLRQAGRTRSAGHIYGALAVVTVLLLAHSAWMQWHIHWGMQKFAITQSAENPSSAATHTSREASIRHLEICQRYGLMHTRGLGRMLGQLYRWDQRPADAIRQFEREIAAGTRNPMVYIFLGHAWAELGDIDRAEQSYRAALSGRLVSAQRFMRLSAFLGEQRKYLAQQEVLRQGLAQHSSDGDLALEMCKFLARCPAYAYRDIDQAVQVAESTCAANNRSHADLLAMLAWLYAETGRPREALATAQESLNLATRQGQYEIAQAMTQMVKEYEAQVQQLNP